jgi:hypothetical protein
MRLSIRSPALLGDVDPVLEAALIRRTKNSPDRPKEQVDPIELDPSAEHKCLPAEELGRSKAMRRKGTEVAPVFWNARP